jgi:hypothetical protein
MASVMGVVEKLRVANKKRILILAIASYIAMC